MLVRSRTCNGVAAMLISGLLVLALFLATCWPISAGPGLRIVSVKSVAKPTPTPFAGAALGAVAPPGAVPLEGPLMAVAIVISDQREGELEFLATAHFGVDGHPLIPNSTDFEVAVGFLDTGAATHLLGYPDAARLGLQDSFLTENTFDVGGVGGSATLDVSQPVGVFAH